MSELRFSVIVPVYNGAETLRECLSALTNQTMGAGEYEVIVIDDGSTDATPDIAAGFPVRLVRLEKNTGRLVARARGAQEAVCEDLVFCDCRVICEPDVLETIAATDKWPLMYGSDFPEEQQASLIGRFFFCVYRRLWKPVYPQEWYADEAPVTADNFDRMPKGLGLFVTRRDFFLRHQPKRRGRHVSDDTLLLSSMVRERPVIRYAAMKCHYRQRTDLRSVLPHVHFRGVLFNSYYLRPGRRFFGLYLFMWAAFAAFAVFAAWRPEAWWVVAAGAVAAWIGASAYLAAGVRNFLAVAVSLPLVAGAFGTGILRGHVIDLWTWLRGSAGGEGPSRLRRLMSPVTLVAIAVLAWWYVRSNWAEFRDLPMIPWWGWPVAAALIASVHVTNGFVLDRMVRPLGVSLRRREWVGLAFLTALGNLLGPARSGLVLRSVYLKRRGLAYSHFVSTLAGSYVLATIAQTALAAGGLAALWASRGTVRFLSGRASAAPVMAVVGAVLAAACVMAVWAPRPREWMKGPLRPAARVLEGWRAILSDRGLVRQMLACCLLIVLVMTVMFWSVFRMLGAPQEAGVVAVIVGLSGLAALVAITPGALGFFDVTAIAGGAFLGVPEKVSLAAVVVFRVTDLVLTLALGSVSTWYLVRSKAPEAPADASQQHD